MEICGIYKITNTITGDFYIGSSKNVKHRWACHKCPSKWKKYPNNPMYQEMQKYGTDKFELQILAEVEIEQLKEKEQQFIEALKPTYNDRKANGLDVERHKETNRKTQNKYDNQLYCYNGKTLTLCALSKRFMRKGFDHPVLEAKKYLIKNIQ